MTDDATRRLSLAAQIMTLEYHQDDAAWLKVVSVATVVDDVDRIPVVTELRLAGDEDTPERRRVQVFLEDHFCDWTPEDSPYSTFVAGTWRPADRARMEHELDRIFAATDAAPRSQDLPGVFDDDAALRRWFSVELWPGATARWFVLESAPGKTSIPAVIALDDLQIGVLWVQ